MSNSQLKTKVCAHCGIEKPASEFYYNKNTKDHLQCWCKSCMYQCIQYKNIFGRVRKCRSCGKILPLDKFDLKPGEDPSNPRAKYQTHCRQCQKLMDMLYIQQQENEKDSIITTASTNDGFSQCVIDIDVSVFTDRELLDELKARGFEGKVYKTETIKTELEL